MMNISVYHKSTPAISMCDQWKHGTFHSCRFIAFWSFSNAV
jgi:hypothetical protein